MTPRSNGGSSASDGKRPTVYQIDFTAVASGKRIASSKRRVRWRFGFANQDALEAGQTGTDCRGEEHDVTIVWSITSGKRLVLADGKEVHYSNSRNNIFDFSWTMRGNHVMKVVAHAQPPMSAQPGFRQYDFFVDGQSFFTFPKVFRLGLAPCDPRGGGRNNRSQQQNNVNMAERRVVPSNYSNNGYYNNYGGGGGSGGPLGSNNISSIEAPNNPDEEEAYLRQAIENSLKEAPPLNNPTNTGANVGAGAPAAANDLLLDFVDPPPAAQVSTVHGGPGPALSLPPSALSYGSDLFDVPSSGVQQQQQPAFAALPLSMTASTAASNVPNSAPPPTQQLQRTENSDPWGMASIAEALPSTQHADSQDPYSSPEAHASLSSGVGSCEPLHQQDPFGGGESASAPPIPISASNKPYASGPASNPVPEPFGSPLPTSITAPSLGKFTPATQASSIGFASPMAQSLQQPFGQHQQHPEQEPKGHPTVSTVEEENAPVKEEAPPPSDPALFSMNVLSGQPKSLVTESIMNGGTGLASGTLADQAYAKLINMDAFDLVQGKDTELRKNPFDINGTMTLNNIGSGNNNTSTSLANMMKSKKPTEKKEIMKSPVLSHMGALVLSNEQQGNFGGYGNQYNMGIGMIGQQQPKQLQQQTMCTIGQHKQPQTQPSMQGYVGGTQQPQSYGQSLPLQQPQAHGMLHQAPPTLSMQQPLGSLPQQQQQVPYAQQPSPMMQQQQPYGKNLPPSMQQQPFGF